MTPSRVQPSRAHPSRRYSELLALYRRMHQEGAPGQDLPAERTFAGTSLRFHLSAIRALAKSVGASSLLDYGSGKGVLYEQQPLTLPDGSTVPSLMAYWGLEQVRCYDPAYEHFAERPLGTFDLVVCTDVLEHCPEEDIDWILGEIFGFARHAVFLCIAAYPAKKLLPNGENAHATVRPPRWWAERLSLAALRRPGVRWQAVVEEAVEDRIRHSLLEADAAPG